MRGGRALLQQAQKAAWAQSLSQEIRGQVPALPLSGLCGLFSLDLPMFPSVKWGHEALYTPPGLA